MLTGVVSSQKLRHCTTWSAEVHLGHCLGCWSKDCPEYSKLPAVAARLQRAQRNLKELAEQYRAEKAKILASMQKDLDLLAKSVEKPGGKEGA